jgi:N-carbamoylputrescine amidase
MRVGLIQLRSELNDRPGTLARVRAAIDAAYADEPPALLVLPELVNTGHFPQYRDWSYLDAAERADGPIVAPIFELAGAGHYYDSALLIGLDGELLSVYGKTHVALLAQEPSGQQKFYFRPGHGFPVWDTPWGRLGVLICYDRNFPEVWRLLVQQGAELIAVPITTDGHWLFRELARVMCYLNGVYGVFVNRVGVEAGREFFGGSLICDPRGAVLAEAGAEETILQATTDLSAVPAARARMPFLRDLRPELYGPLAARE